MSFTPSTAAQNTATLAGNNLANLAAANTAMQTSISGGNLGPAAMMDAILSSVGLQLESNNALTANSTTSTSFVDVPGSSITFTAPLAKSYLVHCDFGFFRSAGTGNTNQVRLVVNGNNGPSIYVNLSTLNEHYGVHLMHSASCAAGSNTIKVQWQASSGVTLNTNTASYANYIVTG